MSINGKFPEQLIAMVSKDMKAAIVAESDRREISISQLVREKIETADAVEVLPARETTTLEFTDFSGTTIEEIRGTDGTLIRSTVVEGVDLTAGQVDRDVIADPETLAAYARNLAPDTEPDEVDGSLSDHEARVARLRARGLG